MLKEKITDFDDHVIITSLGQFFQIDGYAGLFTRMESLKAKNLLMVSKQMPEFGKHKHPALNIADVGDGWL
jgi:hypothetical protein